MTALIRAMARLTLPQTDTVRVRADRSICEHLTEKEKT
jgi:hypothetical protein